MLKELIDVMGKNAVLANFELFAKFMPEYMQNLARFHENWRDAQDPQLKKAVADEAHKIKGALASVSLIRLQQIAQLAQTDNGEFWEKNIASWIEQLKPWKDDLTLAIQWVEQN